MLMNPPKRVAVPPLLRLARDREPGCRIQALECLGALYATNESTLRGLIECLADPLPQVPAARAGVLGKVGNAAAPAVPALTRLLNDSCPEVRLASVSALSHLADIPTAKAALAKVAKGSDAEEHSTAAHVPEKLSPP